MIGSRDWKRRPPSQRRPALVLRGMSSPGSARTLAVGSVMSAATAFRVGATSLTLWSEQAPKLMEHWLKAEEDDDDAARKLRDELFAAARDGAKRVNDEVLRGIDDADRF